MDKTKTEQLRELLSRREAVLDSMQPPEDPFDLQKEIDDFFFENAALLLELVEAAEEMSQRLQSLPFFRSDSGSDAPYCLNRKVWQDWNYGECDKLHEALRKWNGGE